MRKMRIAPKSSKLGFETPTPSCAEARSMRKARNCRNLEGQEGDVALVHESGRSDGSATLQSYSDSSREGFRHSELRHSIEDIADNHRLRLLRLWMTSADDLPPCNRSGGDIRR